MKIKTSVALGITTVIITVVSVILMPESKAQSDYNLSQTEIPVTIKPLKQGNNIVPIEIQCQKVFITKLDTLDNFSCILINNTNKDIRSYSVRYSIIIDSDGKEEQDSRLDTVDTYIHPDLSELKKPVKPGESKFIIPPGPISESDSVIKGLELEPIYVEFSDKTTIGIGGKGAELIANAREGAIRYKNLLRQKYSKKGTAAQELIPFLEDQSPLGTEFENFSQRAGAKAYRTFLRNKYEQEGITAINKVLNN